MYNTKRILLLSAIVLGSYASNDVLAGRNHSFGFIRFVSPHDPDRKEIAIPVGVSTREDAARLVSRHRDEAENFVREYPAYAESRSFTNQPVLREMNTAYELILNVLRQQNQRILPVAMPAHQTPLARAAAPRFDTPESQAQFIKEGHSLLKGILGALQKPNTPGTESHSPSAAKPPKWAMVEPRKPLLPNEKYFRRKGDSVGSAIASKAETEQPNFLSIESLLNRKTK